MKLIKCIDCGCFLEHFLGRQPLRCDNCKKIKRNERYCKYQKKYRKKLSEYSKEYYRKKIGYYTKERHPRKEFTKEEWSVYNHNRYLKRKASGYTKDARQKRLSTPQNRIADNLRNRIWCVLNRTPKKTKKYFKLMDVLGCTLDDLKQHLESLFAGGMSWNNYGRYGWWIDHIRPCASFDLTDPEQQKQCFHYTNLQPLWYADNICKKDKVF